MNKLPRIPSPPSHYWREFRQGFLPYVVFGGVLALTISLWNDTLAPSGIVGEVEMVRANVNTTVAGRVVELQVDLLQRVEKDQVIATLETMEPEVLNASLAAVAADLETARVRLLLDETRNTSSYEQLRLDLQNTKVTLATEKVNLQYAQTEFQRVSKLFQDKAVTEMEYDSVRNQRNLAQSKVDELEKLITETQRSMDRLLAEPGMTNRQAISDPFLAAINTRQEELKQQSKPLVLRAPMSGVISAVLRRPGERAVAGDAIVTISSLQSDRIIGFVRQPVTQKPTLGAAVEVRSRADRRALGTARILRVGTQMEPINPELLPATQSRVPEYGLPILVSLPSELKLMPGEAVDLHLTSVQ